MVSQPILLLLLLVVLLQRCEPIQQQKYALSAQVATSHVTKGWTTV